MSKMKKKWAGLKPGDIVDVVAPGFPTTEEKLKNAISLLNQLGLKVRVPDDLFGEDVVCSQTDEIRGGHLRDALLAKDSKAVWCLRGGYGSLRLIPQMIKWKKPAKVKLLIGYSDTVTLHTFLNQKWDWPSLHGSHLDRLGTPENLNPAHMQEIFDVVMGRIQEVKIDSLVPLNSKANKLRKLMAPVTGGNLTVVNSHIGTALFKSAKNKIVVFEDLGERAYRVDRMLFQLSQAGFFKGVSAVVFGEFTGGKEPEGESKVPDVIERFAKESKFPVFGGLPMGHDKNQKPIPLNTIATLQGGPLGRLSIATYVENSVRAKK